MICLSFCTDHCQAEYLCLSGTLGESVDKQQTRYKRHFEEKVGAAMSQEWTDLFF